MSLVNKCYFNINEGKSLTSYLPPFLLTPVAMKNLLEEVFVSVTDDLGNTADKFLGESKF